MTKRFVVFDSKGIICETPDYEEALEAYESEEDFEGDLIYAEILARRR